jgi:16S rRNA (cytosine967-C5)-methyltransferase
MTPGGRLAAAIEVLEAIETRHRPVAEALKEWGISHRFAGSKDRAAIGNMVYDALRKQASSQWRWQDASARAAVIVSYCRSRGLSAADFDALIARDPHAPAALTETEGARLADDRAQAPGHVAADVPQWLSVRLERTFGADWVEEGAALAERPPLDIRVNRLRADRDKVAKALAAHGVTEMALAPDGLRVPPIVGDGRHPNLQVEPGFQKGWFEIQDEGSQLAALLTGATPGEQVLDLCAGAGGKSLAIAAAMGNKGQVFATDSDRSRLAPIFDRLKRAATRNLQVRPARSDLAELEGRMDVVLLDVPCTGSGTWRRRPDAKWRLSERALADRIAEQSQLLDQAVRFLKPGGRLVYVTCSLLPEENGDQLAAFLDRAAEMTLVPPAAMIDAAPLPERSKSALRPHGGDIGLLMTPRRTETDGFFVGMMRKG